jgi:hypothetical protein
MEMKYLFALIICLSQALMSQTMNVYKTDKTKLDFQLSDIDSISISTTSLGKVSSSNWICFTSSPATAIKPSTGVYEDVEDGLKVYGNGNLYGNAVQLMPNSKISITSKTIYLKWKTNGNGNNVNVGVELFTEAANLTSAGRVLNLSTKQSGSSSIAISDNIWYYTRITVASGNISSITSTENYDTNGGEVISSSSSTLNKDIESYSFQIYADNSSYAVLAESWIE